DILLLDTAFGIDEVVIVHHTDCGSLKFTNEELRERTKARVDKAHWEEIEDIDWGANTDVKGDLEWLRGNKVIRQEIKSTARGFLFDLK
ncbi:hypothetical protein BGZ61DRAFT_299006, partial [Ilyonectria robusta]|uniref:uncharacterized protein n=1 Tax=Ilyonectria robusta TaxID=1079257 RepID=UPI001E8EDBAF